MNNKDRIAVRPGALLNISSHKKKEDLQFISGGEARILQQIETASENAIRKILENMGVGTHGKVLDIQARMKLLDIEIRHVTHKAPHQQEEDGWYFFLHGKLVYILSHPKIDEKNHITFRTRLQA